MDELSTQKIDTERGHLSGQSRRSELLWNILWKVEPVNVGIHSSYDTHQMSHLINSINLFNKWQ